MNGSTENRASGASEKPGGSENILSLPVTRQMLPLVMKIVEEIVGRGQRIDRLHLEKERLDRQRRSLGWPERRRRYLLQDEIADEERHLQDAFAELEVLGVILLDGSEGRVGFPTLVNERRAFFTWQPGENEVLYWHFLGETTRRTIPAHWGKGGESRRSAKLGG